MGAHGMVSSGPTRCTGSWTSSCATGCRCPSSPAGSVVHIRRCWPTGRRCSNSAKARTAFVIRCRNDGRLGEGQARLLEAVAAPQAQAAATAGQEKADRRAIASAPRGRTTADHARGDCTLHLDASVAPNHLTRAHKSYAVRARRSPMTGEELRAALEFFGVPHQRLARHCGCNSRTVSSWITGRRPIPCTVHWVLWVYSVADWTRCLRGPLPINSFVPDPGLP